MARAAVARFAIVGPAQSGKTSLFCVLSGQSYERAVALPKPGTAPVPVRDPRLEELRERENPGTEAVFPTVELHDTPSLSYAAADRPRNVDAFTQFREMEGLIAIVRATDVEGDKKAAIAKEIDALRSELYLEDLEILQRRVERLRLDVKKPTAQQEEQRRELEALERLSRRIEAGEKDAFSHLTAEDEKKLRGFMLFSRKPMAAIANVADADAASLQGEPGWIAMPIKLEMELSAMGPQERKEFLDLYGLKGLLLDGLLLDLYRRMGYVTFFTLGEKETAGWGIRKGTAAFEAAGKIHTDMQKGFVAAEVIGFEELRRIGGMREARGKGRCRNEGKSYVVQDGDIILFKHS